MTARSVLFACLTALLLGPHPAAACSCGRTPTVQEALGRAESVFVGRVAETWPVAAHIMDMDTIARRITLRVATTWKGDPGPEIVLIDPGGCWFPFQRGGLYLVFVHRLSDGERSASICTLTRPWTTGGPESLVLGPGRFVSPGEEVAAESLLHRMARKLKLALLGARFLIVPAWSQLADSPRGVELQLGIELAACTVLIAFALLVRRGRWKWPTLVVALVALAAGLVVLGISYHEIAANPWLKPMIE